MLHKSKSCKVRSTSTVTLLDHLSYLLMFVDKTKVGPVDGFRRHTCSQQVPDSNTIAPFYFYTGEKERVRGVITKLPTFSAQAYKSSSAVSSKNPAFPETFPPLAPGGTVPSGNLKLFPNPRDCCRFCKEGVVMKALHVRRKMRRQTCENISYRLIS